MLTCLRAFGPPAKTDNWPTLRETSVHLSSVSIDNKGFEHSLDLTGASATLGVTTNGNYLLRFSEAGSSLVLTLERDQIDAYFAPT